MEKEFLEIVSNLNKHLLQSNTPQTLIAASNILVANKIQKQNDIYEKLLEVNIELVQLQKDMLKKFN